VYLEGIGAYPIHRHRIVEFTLYRYHLAILWKCLCHWSSKSLGEAKQFLLLFLHQVLFLPSYILFILEYSQLTYRLVIPGEFFRDSIRTLHEDPFIPTQLRVSSFLTLTTVLPLDNLTYLDLSHNDWVTYIPREVLRCTSLRKLDISGCRGVIDGRLPGCLAELRALEWLAADGCDIIAIGTSPLPPFFRIV